MTVNVTQQFTFPQKVRHAIFADNFTQTHELIVFLENGDVVSFDTLTQTQTLLFSVINRSKVRYASGDFDINNDVFMQSMGDFVLIAEKYDCRYFLYQRSTDNLKRFARDDYYSEHSYFPLKLFMKNGMPHLLYSVQWNRVDVVNLTTNEILTATKSLIDERSKNFYEEQTKQGKTFDYFYPTPYDYFYGKILFSPNQNYFLSAGWGWGSQDCYQIYDYADFINNTLIKEFRLFNGEHEERAVCWLDDNHIAIVLNPLLDGDIYDEEDEEYLATTQDFDWLYIYQFADNNATIVQKIQLDFKGLSKCELVYDAQHGLFFAYRDTFGLVVFDKTGKTQFSDKNSYVTDFMLKNLSFIEIKDHSVSLKQWIANDL